MKNPIKSVIEISKFLFDLSPSHQVTIGLKAICFLKLYTILKKVLRPQLSIFTHINFSTRSCQMTYLLQLALLGCVDDVAGTIIST